MGPAGQVADRWVNGGSRRDRLGSVFQVGAS